MQSEETDHVKCFCYLYFCIKKLHLESYCESNTIELWNIKAQSIMASLNHSLFIKHNATSRLTKKMLHTLNKYNIDVNWQGAYRALLDGWRFNNRYKAEVQLFVKNNYHYTTGKEQKMGAMRRVAKARILMFETRFQPWNLSALLLNFILTQTGYKHFPLI